MVRAAGFDVAPSGFEISPSTLAALDVDWSRAGGLTLLRKAMRELVLPALPAAHDAMAEAAAGSDLIVGHANQIAAQMVAEETGCRWAVLSLFPMVVPTTEGLSGAPLPRLPGPLRRPGQRAALAAMTRGAGWVLGDRQLNRFRRSRGLPARRSWFLTAALDSDLMVVPVPDLFVPVPSDWPTNIRLSGFCPGAVPGAAVPDEVEQFLADGPAPVVVTLGSAPSRTSGDRLRAIATLLDVRGVRSLLLVGRDELRAGPTLRDRPGVAVYAPLADVLPRCRAIVHHGGYGTTAAAIVAGVPSVVTPFMPDQLWYGRCTEAIGAGVVVPARRRRDVGAALDHVLHDHSIAERSRTLARALVGTDGASSTADVLETLLA
jgi:rhamnosyltransferase subunit B